MNRTLKGASPETGLPIKPAVTGEMLVVVEVELEITDEVAALLVVVSLGMIDVVVDEVAGSEVVVLETQAVLKLHQSSTEAVPLQLMPSPAYRRLLTAAAAGV